LALIAPLSLRVPVQKPAAVAALLAIRIYLVVSGASVSTQRAFIMSTVFFSAILVDRPALSLRSFSLAMIAVVLLAPESVFAPGFQMSFAATGVLIAIYEAWSRRRTLAISGLIGRGAFAAKSLVVTSVAASLATAPFAVFHFERLAPLGLLANLAAMPVVSLLCVPAAGLAILLAPFGFSHIGLALFGRSLEIVLFIAEETSRYGEMLSSPIKTMPVGALLCFTGGLIALVLFRRWLRNTSGSQYEIIALTEGDALGPLRFRYASKGAGCDQHVCRYETSQGLSVVLKRQEAEVEACDLGEENSDILVLNAGKEAGRSKCRNQINWSEIEQFGGVEVRFENGQIIRRHARKCSARPWRKCL